MLAAQAAADAPRPKGLGRKLSRLFARGEAADAPHPMLPPPAPPPACEWAKLDDALLLSDPLDAVQVEPVAPEILLGAFCPRRPAFGQRMEESVDLLTTLHAQGPHSPHEGVLGETELLLHSGDAIQLPPRRPREPLHTETPFFPEDLADDPAHRPLRRLTLAPQPAPPTKKPKKPAPQTPAPDLAGSFLLATLAALLASEEAALRQNLAALPTRARAA